MSVLDIWTDATPGSCNIVAGWAFIVRTKYKIACFRGDLNEQDAGDSTYAEFKAIHEACKHADRYSLKAAIKTDSKTLVSTLRRFANKASLDAFRSFRSLRLKTLEEAQALQALLKRVLHSIEWVRGHAGDPFNSLADRFAKNVSLNDPGRCTWLNKLFRRSKVKLTAADFVIFHRTVDIPIYS